MIKFLQFLVFLPIQIILIPFTIIGYIIVAYKEIKGLKKRGIHPTIMGSTYSKWLMHYFGIRNDEMTVEFFKKLPVTSHFCLLLMFGPAIIANRICGYTPTMAAVPEPGTESLISFRNTKTIDFDNSMEKYVSRVDQVVVMGGGFDIRVLKFTAGKKLKVFEIDLEPGQNLKLQALKKAGIKHDLITYIPIDFNKESWVDKLIANGYDMTKKTFFLWESASAYLEEDVIEDTLRKVVEFSTVGSSIAQDFFSLSFIDKMKKKSRTLRDNVLFGMDLSGDPRQPIESFLKKSGLTLTKLIIYGDKTKSKMPMCAITDAEKR